MIRGLPAIDWIFAERRLVVVADRVAPVEVVQQVERLDAELQVARPGQREQPRHRQIDRPVSRTGDAVDDVIAERAIGRVGEGGGIQIVVDRLRAVRIVEHLVQALRADAGGGDVAPGRHRDPRPGPRAHDARHAPVGRDRAKRGAAELAGSGTRQ